MFETPLGLGQFGKENLFGGNAAQLPGQTELRQGPDNPFRWINLSPFHSVAVIVLKFVMIIMITFTEGHDRHDP